MDEKRLLLAGFLTVLVLILWSALLPKPPEKSPPALPAAAPAAPAASPAAKTAPAPPALPATAAESEERVVVDRPLYRAVFSNRGAVLASFVLKNYRDDSGNPLDMVHTASAQPFAIEFGGDAADTAAAGAALYRVERSRSGSDDVVRFLFSDGRFSVAKTFRLGGGYLFSADVEASGVPHPLFVLLGPGLRNLSEREKANRFIAPPGAVYGGEEGVETAASAKVKEARSGKLPGGSFAGLEDNYFLTVLLPSQPFDWRILPAPSSDPAGIRVAVGTAGAFSGRVFFGPKDLDVLAPLRLNLEKTVSFKEMGINLAFIAKPLIWMLKTSYRRVMPNWGVAILLVTFVLRLAMFPLMQKSYAGMKKMQKLQPKIQAIRQKYKNAMRDPGQREKMNREVMALYSSEGYNPASGCLPLLLQMPIFFAFYIVLEHAIFLRQAPFALWIHDLSAKDPTYVLVMLMTATMFGQQLLMPSVGDSMQRRIMLIMPLAWGFFLKDMPAGLVLYWLFSNVLTIAQQLLMNKFTRPEPAVESPRGRAGKARSGG